MAARAIWKGRIQFGAVDVPVKLYSAVQDQAVRFRMLDAKKNRPIQQHMIDPDSGEIVDRSDIRRAFENDSGELVILDDAALQELEPEAAREIEVTRFVDPGAITHQWYDRPYFLGPDGNGDGYFALADALKKQQKEGVAKWVMRNKEYVGSLRVDGDYLMLITLRRQGEVIPASALRPPSGRDLDEREISMAKQLLSAMEDELDIAAYKDDYRERVLEFVQARAEGKVVKFPKAPKKRSDRSLSDVLERSLAATQKEKRSA